MRGMWSRIPFGKLRAADGEVVTCLGGIFAQLASPREEAVAKDEAFELLEDLFLPRTTPQLLSRLHHLASTLHSSFLAGIWADRRSLALLRRTCSQPAGSVAWQALLLHSETEDAVPLLCASLDQVERWTADAHGSQFLMCALQHAHPAASHALARRALRGMRRGALDLHAPRAADVFVHICRMGFPSALQTLRLASASFSAKMLQSAERRRCLRALCGASKEAADAVEYFELWAPGAGPLPPLPTGGSAAPASSPLAAFH